ncbi:hypothetical protein ACFWNK_00355 [Streptomyces sp. NPDC058417]|uniref:hypothetical protein n=1 Tax=unclassified Streptomyces TaxID=2593676 RepID=UPI003661A4FA
MNLRLLALGGAVACAIAVPLAMASAGPVGGEARSVLPKSAASAVSSETSGAGSSDTSLAGRGADGGAGGGDGGGSGDGAGRGRVFADPRTDPKGPGVPAGAASPSTVPEMSDASDPARLLGVGVATAARCGPELTSPDGVEAQTCVLDQGADTWARTYYRNATGRVLDAVLSFMGPDGRAVRMRCAVGADDEPGTCETPREARRGGPGQYTAVAEFARTGGGAPLLLRSGSNSTP